MDTSGKGGTVRHVVGEVDPQGVTITSFKAPTREEQAHDFLWRIRRRCPAPGMIGVFDRSHYEDVLIVRVHELVPKRGLEPALRDDQPVRGVAGRRGDRRRQVLPAHLQGGAEGPAPRPPRQPGQALEVQPQRHRRAAHWEAYQEAYEDALERCNTEPAPWYVVPSRPQVVPQLGDHEPAGRAARGDRAAVAEGRLRRRRGAQEVVWPPASRQCCLLQQCHRQAVRAGR